MSGNSNSAEKALYNNLCLGQRNIRLLNVIPTTDASAISCTMRTISLDNPEPYAALSYAWGDATRRKSIPVNGYPIAITESLHSALKNMTAVASPLNIWADAICINQSDDSERSQQVRVMGEIYSRAAGVLVWLGHESEESALAVNLIQEWGSKYHPDIGMDTALRNINDPFNQKAWTALGRLLQRPWWSRLWTVQEVALNKNVDVFIGKSNYEWKTVIRACMAWDSLDYIEQATLGGQDKAAMVSEAIDPPEASAKITLWIERHLMGREFPDIVNLVRFCTVFSVTDPHDRIYALLGMTGPVAGFDVDYTKSTDEIYTRFMKAMIQNDRLDIIRHATYVGSSTPSWIPDWKRINTSFFHADLNNAALGSKAAFEFSKDLRTLQISAILYDAIAEIGQADDLERVLSILAKLWGRTYHGNMSILEALLRWTQVDEHSGKRLSKDLLNAEEVVTDFAVDLAQCCSEEVLRGAGLDYSVSDALPSEIFHSIYMSLARGQSISPKMGAISSRFSTYHQNKERITQNRSFFVTSKGFLGLMTGSIELGDVVCVFLGLCVPMILRKVDQHYLVIGECFLLGLMDGEAVHDLQAGKVKVDDIELW
jgi:hypothetical protein